MRIKLPGRAGFYDRIVGTGFFDRFGVFFRIGKYEYRRVRAGPQRRKHGFSGHARHDFVANDQIERFMFDSVKPCFNGMRRKRMKALKTKVVDKQRAPFGVGVDDQNAARIFKHVPTDAKQRSRLS